VTLAADLVTTLTGDSAVNALVAGRVSPLKIPEGSPLPAISYQVITGAPVSSSQGKNATGNYTVQVDCWGALPDQGGYLAADDLARKVLAALDAATLFKVVCKDRRDGLDDTTEVPRVSLDFSIWHTNP
jgi:Protein of unknown function (DUF3168)